jgi:acyl-coenzyme A thioesterase PaaI-like protein
MSTTPFTVRDPNYVARVKDAFGRQGFLRHIDARVEEIAPGRCVIAADFRSELAQQNGFFHGGLLGTIADAAGAGAAATLIEAQQWLLTAEYKINFSQSGTGTSSQSYRRSGPRRPDTDGIAGQLVQCR